MNTRNGRFHLNYFGSLNVNILISRLNSNELSKYFFCWLLLKFVFKLYFCITVRRKNFKNSFYRGIYKWTFLIFCTIVMKNFQIFLSDFYFNLKTSLAKDIRNKISQLTQMNTTKILPSQQISYTVRPFWQ